MSNDQIITVASKDLSNNLELLFDAAIVVSRAGIIVSVNGQASYLFGYDVDEMIGKELDLLLPERLRENHHRHRKHYFMSPISRTMGTGLHLYGLKRDKNEFPIDVGLRSIVIDNELHALAVVRDKTEIVAVQAVFAERLATFTQLSTSVEQLQKMIETQLAPIDTRVAIVEETLPQLVTRVSEIEESMSDLKEIKPTLERIAQTYGVADKFFKRAGRFAWWIGGIVVASVLAQLGVSLFHSFGH